MEQRVIPLLAESCRMGCSAGFDPRLTVGNVCYWEGPLSTTNAAEYRSEAHVVSLICGYCQGATQEPALLTQASCQSALAPRPAVPTAGHCRNTPPTVASPSCDRPESRRLSSRLRASRPLHPKSQSRLLGKSGDGSTCPCPPI